ncbi:MAG: hypothetical protein ACRDL3_00205 [Solirubrobacterales bacterium]
MSEDLIYVLMANHEEDTDIEVFLARPEATGVPASEMLLESLEIVTDGDPDLVAFLRDEAPRIEAELSS